MDKLSEYTYDLPERLIAQTPLADRSASRLLHLERGSGQVRHYCFSDCVDLLSAGDLLVLNDTRVSALRLLGNKATGGKVELLLLRQVGERSFEALAKPAKSLVPGTYVKFGPDLVGQITDRGEDGLRTVRFDGVSDLTEKLASAGQVPLPPYIHESLDNPERYQTVYAKADGSAAAPTAGLHFTPDTLANLQAKGVQIAWVTLHVGLDTFRPVQADDLSQHHMHGEVCSVPDATAAAIEACRGRVIAVGTTTVRTLESFATGPKTIAPGTKSSSLFIRPPYEFKIVDGMFTNFHLPHTTMLVMISAMAGREAVLTAYREAVQQNYRFLSFGDSMLIL